MIVRALAILVVLAACGGRPTPPPAALSNAGPAPAAPAAPALSDRDAIVRAVLERYLADPTTLPDAGLLRDPGGINVVVDPAGVAAAALPANPARPFALRRPEEVQAAANQLGAEVSYVRISIDLTGDRAVVVSGGDFALPAAGDAIKMCCCAAFDIYEKHDGRWWFVARTSTRCG